MKHIEKHLTLLPLALMQILSLPALAQHKGHAPAHEPQQQTQGLSDAQQIEQVMKKLFDKPQSPLKVAPIAMEGENAVAGWLQDGRGGRALLQKRHGQWSITLCAGDGLKHAQTLEQAGMKPAAAARLVAKMAAQEARLPADVLKKFASFEGVVKIDAQAAHGHGHGHGAPATTPH